VSQIRLRRKVWLEVDGKPLLGSGRVRLLNAIAACGSISAACQQLGIAYRKAWAQLQEMEQLAPFPVLERSKGGKGGGRTTLTAETISMLKQYAEVTERIDRQLDDCGGDRFQLPKQEPPE
jgi:molybdate transport system regulatory protein